MKIRLRILNLHQNHLLIKSVQIFFHSCIEKLRLNIKKMINQFLSKCFDYTSLWNYYEWISFDCVKWEVLNTKTVTDNWCVEIFSSLIKVERTNCLRWRQIICMIFSSRDNIKIVRTLNNFVFHNKHFKCKTKM